jgi:peptidylprolyl isomerase
VRLAAFVCAAALAALALAPTAGAAPAAPAASQFRPLDAANTLVIDTNQGRIVVELYPQVAPDTVARVLALARAHFYDGLTFFRVVDGFMDQTGDPLNNGQGGSSLANVKPEFTFRHAPGQGVADAAPLPGGELGFVGALPVVSQPDALAAMTVDGQVEAFPLFCQGAIGFARADAPDSGNSQFFLMRDPMLNLDEKYTAFGRVIVGESVVRAIKVGEPVVDPKDVMSKVQVMADMPEADRPHTMVLDTSGAYFKGIVARARAAKRDDFDPCAIPVLTTGG